MSDRGATHDLSPEADATGRQLCAFEPPQESDESRADITQPWSRPWQEVAAGLQVAPEVGLSGAEVSARRRRYGANCLRMVRRETAWRILVNQFRSVIVLLLLAAAAVSFASGELPEAYAVVAVIIINTGIGFLTEWRAVRSMEALQRLGSARATVRREGRMGEVAAEEIVPGDILVLEAGHVLPADGRLVQVSRLEVDESILTGESFPVTKTIEPAPAEAPVPDRTCMVFRGTAVTRGSGVAAVTATAMATEVGQVTRLVAEAEPQETPLERRLNQLGQRLVWITLVLTAIIIALGLVQGRDMALMLRTGIALAVATIPEGLPIVATAALARGMWRMARRNALINRLSAVETLGATSVVCTDKTGTLTENRMTVRRLAVAGTDLEVSGSAFDTSGEFRLEGTVIAAQDHPLLDQALRIGVLCNSAFLPHDDPVEQAVGDPMEVALLVAGVKAGLTRHELIAQMPQLREEAFDPEARMMATYHRAGARVLVAVKGAPESVLPVCRAVLAEQGEVDLDETARRRWDETNRRLAGDGLRVLALARKTVHDPQVAPYSDLTLVGLVGLLDPPRDEAKAALDLARAAGVRVVMMTGDQALTARDVARAVGLTDGAEEPVTTGRELKPVAELTEEEKREVLQVDIFARVSPRQKLDLIQLYQQQGWIVAMTGDGVNDAPALRKADIGIAMGRRGTQVAREAADMVLLDDSFNTIVYAIEQGRVIYHNIRQFIVYLLSCNISEIMIVGLASLVNAPLPILPLQILFLNLITDVFPAIALGAGEGNRSLMQRPPRSPHEPLVASRHWQRITAYGMLITLVTLAAFAAALLWLKLPLRQATTVSFATLALAQLWHVFNMRAPDSSILNNEITRNRYVWAALVFCAAVTIAAMFVKPAAQVLHLDPPGASGWLLIVLSSVLPLILGQMLKPWERRQSRRAHMNPESN